MQKRTIRIGIRQESGNSIWIHTLRSVFGRVLLGMAFVLIFSVDAHAQFIVQPMQINLNVSPGTRVRKSFKLENRDRYESQVVKISVVDLVQERDGTWAIFDPNMLTGSSTGFNYDKHLSCKDWISVGAEDATVPAFDVLAGSMMLVIPSRAKGFYCAGLKVALEPRPGLGGVAVKYDFVVPICVSIEGRALRSDVKPVGSGLKFVKAGEDQQESTSVTVTIKNDGGTHSRLAPFASIWQVLPSRTSLIRRDVPLPPIGIIPGAEIELATNLQTSLPTGTYKIVTRLGVDGRQQGKPMIQEVKFNNPVFTGMAHQAAGMRLIPDQVDLEVNPGRIGNQQIVLRNYSDEDIVVKAIPVVPEAMAGKYLVVRGEDLSCADWTRVVPDEMLIRAGSERKVSVRVRMPKEENLPVLSVDPTNYYATVKFYGFYRDKSSAGMTSATINVMRRGAEPVPVIQGKDVKIQSLAEPSRFQLVGEFSNFGLVHVVPTCVGRIQSEGAPGSRINYGTVKMVNQDSNRNLMPYETRQFSAEMDFSRIPEGKYIVTVRLDFGRGVDMNKEIQKMYEVVHGSNGEKLVFSAEETVGSVASSGG